MHRRGIYRMLQGETVLDALDKAGGIKDKLSLPSAVLRTKIEKNCRIHVAPEGEGRGKIAVGTLGAPEASGTLHSIPINTASLEDLMTLPGIDPKTAQAISKAGKKGGISPQRKTFSG